MASTQDIPRPNDWRGLLLYKLGAPLNHSNYLGLGLWAQSEGMPDNENNWLAITWPPSGGSSHNSVGVQIYPSIAAGVDATIRFMQAGAEYHGIISALKKGDDLTALFVAVNITRWCANCQSGHYPVALYEYIHGHHIGTGGSQISVGGAVSTVHHKQWDYSQRVSVTGKGALGHGESMAGLSRRLKRILAKHSKIR